MDRVIAQVFDDPCFGDKGVADQRAERALVDQRRQRRVMGRARNSLIGVEPFDGALQRQSCIKTSAAWVRQRRGFRRPRQIKDRRKFRLEEGFDKSNPGVPVVDFTEMELFRMPA